MEHRHFAQAQIRVEFTQEPFHHIIRLAADVTLRVGTEGNACYGVDDVGANGVIGNENCRDSAWLRYPVSAVAWQE